MIKKDWGRMSFFPRPVKSTGTRPADKRKRAGVHTVYFCRRPVKPSFNRKNGAPVLKGD